MPHAVSLGLEITLIVLVWYNFDRYIFYDFQTVCFETYALYRIVGEQTHFVYTEMTEHLCTATIVALVWLETEMGIGVNGIVAFFLKLVGCNLVHQTDAASFLLHVDNNSLSCLVYHLHGLVELLTAVTTLAAQNVACSARRVNTDQDRLAFFPFSLDECHVFQAIA